MLYDARGKLTITVDLATADPARSSFPVCDTTEIATEPGVLVIKEVAPQLTIDWRWMPPEFGGDPANRHATIAHAHDRITLFKTEMLVVSSHCASS
jgi:hypothetical protein